jgi:hypothetical protein
LAKSPNAEQPKAVHLAVEEVPVGKTSPVVSNTLDEANTLTKVSNEKLTPESFGKIKISEDVTLLNHWNDAMRSAASSPRSNGYTRYLDSLNKGDVLNQKIL